jgi:hypothetical protein
MLREAEVLQAQGLSIHELVKKLGIIVLCNKTLSHFSRLSM